MSDASLAADVRERDAREAVGADLDAGHVAARAREQLVVVEVDDVAVAVEVRDPALVDLTGFVGVGGRAGLLERLVALGVGLAAVVRGAFALLLVVEVAVGVDAA